MELTLKDFTVTEKEKAGTDTDTPYKSDLYLGGWGGWICQERYHGPGGGGREEKGREGRRKEGKQRRKKVGRQWEGGREAIERQHLLSVCYVPHTEIRPRFLPFDCNPILG